MNEVWKDIPGYEGCYQASSLGNIKSLSRLVGHPKGGLKLTKEKIIKKQKGSNGYLIVGIYKNGEGGSKTVHRLIALTFIENPDNKKEVNHKDGHKKNNTVENLEWATVSENRHHAFDTGLQKGPMHMLGMKGALCKHSKPVFKLLLSGKRIRYVSTIDAQIKTGVDRSMISKCAMGKMKMAGGYKWEYA